MSLSFIGAFESTYLPAHDVDILETSDHARRWRADLALLRDCGVTRLRYPVRWHRVEPQPLAYDWSSTDEVLGFLHDEGFEPIVDLVHHTSYPRWLAGGFADPGFGPAYLRYCEAFARRYPWVREYTLFNEPFATLFLAGHEGIWPPYGRGMEALVSLFANVLPPLATASRMYRDLLPAGRHVYVDTCEGHSATDDHAGPFAAMANDRRFFVLDALLGRLGSDERPFVREVLQAGGEDLLAMEPGHVDVLGLDYYAHSEWCFSTRPASLRPASSPSGLTTHPVFDGAVPSPQPVGPAALILEYAERYEFPLILGETNVRGASSDRATWLKYTLEQCELAQRSGAPLEGYCWFPFIDSLDWNSLLARADRCIDPVGVYWLDEGLERHASSMSRSFRRAASGVPSEELPAYKLTPEVSEWVSALLPQMAHYRWLEPPEEEIRMSERGLVRARAAERAA